MPSFGFHRIVILESLPPDEFATGVELYNYLKPLIEREKYPSDVEVHKFASAVELSELISNLTQEALSSENIPILHIESHGKGDGMGLVFSDRSEMSWFDLADMCVALNKATNFNLLLSVAACCSGDFYEFAFSLEKPAPFCTFIAVSDEANGPEMLGGFRVLYRNLLENKDAWSALERVSAVRLNEAEFVIRVAHDVFFRIHEFKFGVQRSREAIDKLAKDRHLLLTKRYGSKIYVPPLKNLKQIIANSDRNKMNKDFYEFFMVKDIPENEKKFEEIKIELEKLLEKY